VKVSQYVTTGTRWFTFWVSVFHDQYNKYLVRNLFLTLTFPCFDAVDLIFQSADT